MGKHLKKHKSGRLGELSATAICGNDITSSCLYVSALSIVYAGKWAGVALLLVAGVLFLFRKIYAEVVGALPLNGGAYNALLNTTSKRWASLAACLTLLSYMATAVISANEAMHYAHRLWSGLPILESTIGLLAIFMFFNILGIRECSQVAVIIFLTHILTLTLLILVGIIFLVSNSAQILFDNFRIPTEGNLLISLFYGFSAAMLGISGFESSSNFVEEQDDGVFPKTLRNMWIAITIFNPAMAFLALATVPISEVTGHQEALLAHIGLLTGGQWLARLVSLDATLVLSGAVLTSYVGVTGLVRRMTLDRCLPQFLLKVNRRGSSHRIIIGFFLLSISILLITGAKLGALAGVYTISFLSVMALFGVGNILLKVRRTRLPRPAKASWTALIIGISAVLAGLVGNAWMNPAYLGVFLIYFIPTVLVVTIMLGRIGLLRVSLFVIHTISQNLVRLFPQLTLSIGKKIEEINSHRVVFFTRGDNIANLNEAMLYVRHNEHTNLIKIVTVTNNESTVSENLKQDLQFLDKAYPEIDIEFMIVKGLFGPKLIQRLSQKWGIPTNFMFMGSPVDHFPYSLAELGGVRLII